MIFKQLALMASLLAKKEGRTAYRTWKPFSITSFHMMKRLKFTGIPFATILDGGANIGQFARAAAENYPEARIISFEPLPDVSEIFRKNLKDRGDRVRMIPVALGRKEGTIPFYRNSQSYSSSALPFHENHLKSFPWVAPGSELKVSLTTLDKALTGEKLEGPVLLKLDLQGYELEALMGASATLRKVEAVLLETSFITMYQGEPAFEKIEDFLMKKGFRFSRILDFMKDGEGNIVQMDGLFLKRK